MRHSLPANGKGLKTSDSSLREKSGILSKKNPTLSDIQSLTIGELIQLYAYAESIVETIREPLIVLTADLKVKSANRAFYRTFRTSKSDTEGKYIYDLGNAEWDIPNLRKLLENILPLNSHFDDYEVSHNFKSIGKKVMLLNARRINFEGNKTSLILLAIEDITHRKQIEKQKEDFISMATHELKTPLTSIKAFSQIITAKLQKSVDKPTLNMAERMEGQINNLVKLIAELLDSSRIQSGKILLDIEKFNLDSLISNTVNDVYTTTTTTTIPYSIVVKGKTNATISGDRFRISQVLLNLLTNAIKYSPENNKIIVRAKKDKNYVTVSVQDFGIGIPEDKLEHVFERFYQASIPKSQGRLTSLGLGLYISSEIVKRHGGKIWCKSKEGKGSTFYFTLPLKSKT